MDWKEWERTCVEFRETWPSQVNSPNVNKWHSVITNRSLMFPENAKITCKVSPALHQLVRGKSLGLYTAQGRPLLFDCSCKPDFRNWNNVPYFCVMMPSENLVVQPSAILCNTGYLLSKKITEHSEMSKKEEYRQSIESQEFWLFTLKKLK